MNWRPLVLSGAFGLMVALAVPAAAHHSFTAGYEADKRVTVTGTVTRFNYMSPHSLIFIDAAGADGATQSWVLELGSPLLLSRAGWNATTFKFGDVITAVGAPARTGALRMYIAEINRAADGFQYKAESKASP